MLNPLFMSFYSVKVMLLKASMVLVASNTLRSVWLPSRKSDMMLTQTTKEMEEIGS